MKTTTDSAPDPKASGGDATAQDRKLYKEIVYAWKMPVYFETGRPVYDDSIGPEIIAQFRLASLAAANELAEKYRRELDFNQELAMEEAAKRGKAEAEKSNAESTLAAKEAELELERMRAAAMMTATLQNTESTIKDRITRDNPYWSQGYADVCAAVDREIRLRSENQSLRQRVEGLSKGLREVQDFIWNLPQESACAAYAVADRLLEGTPYHVTAALSATGAAGKAEK